MKGKPKSETEARENITSYCGKEHFVYSGVCLRKVILKNSVLRRPYPSDIPFGRVRGALNNFERYRGITTSFHVKTEVLFGEHTPEIIDWYLSTGEYKDKAGGYGTQAIGAFLIKEIRGCYYNVMGLPIHRLIEEIMKLTSKEN